MPEVWGWDCGMEAGWFARSLMTRTRQLTLRCPKRWPVQWRMNRCATTEFGQFLRQESYTINLR
jgi:hypothetical protein